MRKLISLDTGFLSLDPAQQSKMVIEALMNKERTATAKKTKAAAKAETNKEETSKKLQERISVEETNGIKLLQAAVS